MYIYNFITCDCIYTVVSPPNATASPTPIISPTSTPTPTTTPTPSAGPEDDDDDGPNGGAIAGGVIAAIIVIVIVIIVIIVVLRCVYTTLHYSACHVFFLRVVFCIVFYYVTQLGMMSKRE